MPGCERLRDWCAVGPAQRAAFQDAATLLVAQAATAEREAFRDHALELARDAIKGAVEREREACAQVCSDRAMHCESDAQRAIENGEHDEVSAIRATAWQISVCAADIRTRGKQ